MDPELLIFNLSRALRCAPFFDSYNLTRMALNDPGVVANPFDDMGNRVPVDNPQLLTGFHTSAPGMYFKESYTRGGWPGNYYRLFDLNLFDRLQYFYFSTLRPRFIRRIERYVKGHGGDGDGSGDGSKPFGGSSRGGWPGNYYRLFDLNLFDRLQYFYFSTLRPRFIRRIERYVKGLVVPDVPC
eukprot:gene10147-8049_t